MRRTLSIVALALICSCGGGETTSPGSNTGGTNPGGAPVPPVASVTIAPTGTVTLSVGQTAPLTATTLLASGTVVTGRAVTWASSSSTVASVSGEGLITALAVGAATITATSEGKSAAVAVLVTSLASGSFTGLVGGQVLALTLIENGGAVAGTGTLSHTPTGVRALTVTGAFTNNALTATISSGTGTPFNLQGAVASSTITGTLAGSGFSADAITLYRAGVATPAASQWVGTYALFTTNGNAVPGAYSVLGYASSVVDRTLSLASDGTGTWHDSTSSNLFCSSPNTPATTLCDASGRGSVAWTANGNVLKVGSGAVFSGRFVSPKTFTKQADGTLLKNDDSEIEVYKKQ